jgi:hypothetical protein
MILGKIKKARIIIIMNISGIFLDRSILEEVKEEPNENFEKTLQEKDLTKEDKEYNKEGEEK